LACANNPGPDGTSVDSGSTQPDVSNSVDLGVNNIPDSSNPIEDGEGSSGGLYPAGPYGVNEGEILQDLAFLLPEGDELRLSDIRNIDGAKILMVSTSAGWCTACIEEQPKLQSFYETYGPQGLQVMVSLFEDQNYNPATHALAKQWQAQYDLDIWIVADPDFVWDAYYDSSLTPMNMIVRLEDMTILYLKTGFDESTVEAIIKASL
jgi:thiol-disulfide isomerase/thioredoxin